MKEFTNPFQDLTVLYSRYDRISQKTKQIDKIKYEIEKRKTLRIEYENLCNKRCEMDRYLKD